MRVRQVCMIGEVLLVLTLAGPLAAVTAATAAARGTAVQRTIRLTLRDGSSQVARLDGVGCSESLCSRTVVNTRAIGSASVHHTRLDDVATVRDIEPASVVLLLKDGSTRRVSVVPENRVLYVTRADGRQQKIDLDRLASIEFDAHASK